MAPSTPRTCWRRRWPPCAEAKNLSFFAFTATPKAKTLELFGHKGIDGTPHPFHLYSMQQAIEEGFILSSVVRALACRIRACTVLMSAPLAISTDVR